MGRIGKPLTTVTSTPKVDPLKIPAPAPEEVEEEVTEKEREKEPVKTARRFTSDEVVATYDRVWARIARELDYGGKI